MTEEGCVGGRGNLDVEMRGMKDCRRGEETGGAKREGVGFVDGWLGLMATCYHGEEGEGYEGLEQRVVDGLVDELKKGDEAKQEEMGRMVLSMIAAEYDAGVRLRGKYIAFLKIFGIR